MTKLIVCVDCQIDFVTPNGAMFVERSDEIFHYALDYFANLDVNETFAVLFTFDTHDRVVYPFTEESKQFPLHCVEGEPGWANVFNPDMINVNIPVYRARKPVFDLWEKYFIVQDWRHNDLLVCDSKEFSELLTQVQPTVEIFGVASDYCVKYAVDGFRKLGLTVNIIDHLCEGIEKQIDQVYLDNEDGKLNII